MISSNCAIMRFIILHVLISLLPFYCVCSTKSRSRVFTSDKHNKVVYSTDNTTVQKANLSASELLRKTYIWISWFKFHQIDFRPYAHKGEYPGFTERFMRPPLYEVFDEIKDSCDRNFGECLLSVYKLSRDTIHYTDQFELFRARASAMYYMCWYTMLEEPLLSHFGFHCQVPPLHQNETELEGWQRDYSDYRDRDVGAYDCALLNFCPDPCCGGIVEGPYRQRGVVDNPDHCLQLPTNACNQESNGTANCFIVRRKNRDFVGLATNKLNTSCDCAGLINGFAWNDDVRMCVDIDECASGNFDCENNSVCRNLPGSYYCTCSLGYKFDGRTSCGRDADFEYDEAILKQVEAGQTELVRRKSVTVSRLFSFLLPSSASPTVPETQRTDSLSTAALCLCVIVVTLFATIPLSLNLDV